MAAHILTTDGNWTNITRTPFVGRDPREAAPTQAMKIP